MDLNPDDRISFRIEVLRPAKGLHADGVFLQILPASLNSACGQELKQLL
jgi:hypothetical protein